MDVVVRFTAFDGAEYLTLVECKHHKNSIKRELVQALHSKLQSVGGQKAMMFSTAKFQRGAIEFAQVHNISLVHFRDNEMTYCVKSRLIDALEVFIDDDENTDYKMICKGTAIQPPFDDLLRLLGENQNEEF
jgi:restriction system protein